MLPCPAVDLTTCKLIAFDLDGTLYPSGIEIGKVVLVAHKDYMLQHNLDIPTPDLEWVKHLIGKDAKSFYREMLPGQPPEVVQDFEDFCLDYERGVVARFPDLYPGAVEVLKALKACGRTLVLVTNGGPTYAKHVWDAAGLGKWLSARYPFEPPEYASKGDRLSRAVAEWGGGPAVMVGDRHSDKEAAEYAGAAYIAARYGFALDGELTGEEYVIDGITGLYNLLLTPEERQRCGIQ